MYLNMLITVPSSSTFLSYDHLRGAFKRLYCFYGNPLCPEDSIILTSIFGIIIVVLSDKGW